MTPDAQTDPDARAGAARPARLGDLPPPGPLTPLQRAYVSPTARRVVPLGVVLAAKRLRSGLRGRHVPAELAECRRAMELLLGASSRAGDAEALAPRHLAYNAARTELNFRPWLGAQIEIEGIERLRALGREGGLVHFLHHGPYHHLSGVIRRGAGVEFFGVVNREWLEPTAPGMSGAKYRAALQTMMLGAEMVVAEGSALRLRRLLTDGRVVALSSDVPGRLETSFLGRRVGVAPGAAKLSIATGRPVVCIAFRRRRRGLPVAVAHAPLTPAAFAGPGELQAAISAVHEPYVLAWPEAVDLPAERWAVLG